jgi:hypothetical protein
MTLFLKKIQPTAFQRFFRTETIGGLLLQQSAFQCASLSTTEKVRNR